MFHTISRAALCTAFVAGLFCGAASPVLADDLATIKENGTFSAAMSGQYPPFSMVDEKNEVIGFDVDITNEIARRLGVNGNAVTTTWDGIIPGLLTKKYDAIIGSMAITEDRLKAVDFVGPYYHDGRGIFVLDKSEAKGLDDLKDKVIGVTLGETHEKWAREQGGWTIRTYKGLPELIMELKAGRVDAVVVDYIALLTVIKQTSDPIRMLDIANIEGAKIGIGIAIRKNNPELKAAMQKALDDMMTDGTYETISTKWIGRDIR
ncbi:transporter substrate-binding domain-containing protein [Pseudochrobactrum asaccharolyticum]|uniref:Amino acid ABC transporter substrate-binding protein (PAAT family) n=1 Tax=Pseudochrobactrum asaccharolyticum TaxID=354351 RepID=A0A366E6A7_9HYPH|nr:transporter substrate-binding domain-containing protein [Pseudochrobactrum asaccharolyticum]RBO97309.1 amino acid ABC transporter substrate-binding protein (PAAT family) [Pseudochrobactrum asaccharolyticum]